MHSMQKQILFSSKLQENILMAIQSQKHIQIITTKLKSITGHAGFSEKPLSEIHMQKSSRNHQRNQEMHRSCISPLPVKCKPCRRYHHDAISAVSATVHIYITRISHPLLSCSCTCNVITKEIQCKIQCK